MAFCIERIIPALILQPDCSSKKKVISAEVWKPVVVHRIESLWGNSNSAAICMMRSVTYCAIHPFTTFAIFFLDRKCCSLKEVIIRYVILV